MKYFLAVCETLNFTKAAELCGVSQPALSRAIQQLEDEVGGLLFRRERHLTHVTDLGMLMRPHFEHIIAELGSVEVEVRRFLTTEQAHCNLGIMCTIGPTRFTGLLGHFSHRFPDTMLQLTEGTPPELLESLDSGAIDIALMASADGYPPRFRAEPLYSERFLIAFPPGHRFEKMAAIPIAAINGENYLRRLNCEYRGHLSELAEACGADTHLGFASEREDWIQNMVAAGMGICFIPEFSAIVPGIMTRPVSDPAVSREVAIVSLAAKTLPEAAGKFIDAALDYHFSPSRFETMAAA
jgi:DNA-binding transcriptional LysR family regulator